MFLFCIPPSLPSANPPPFRQGRQGLIGFFTYKLKFIGVSKRTIKAPGVVPLLYIRQYVNCTTEPKLAWSLSVEICLQSAWSLRSGCGADLGQAQGMPRKTKKALDSCQVLFSWWRRRGSNSRPYGCEPYALPAELRPHMIVRKGWPHNNQ